MARGKRVQHRRAASSSAVNRAVQQTPTRQSLLAAAAPMPSEMEVLRAVASLYDDELRPYSRILRKRIVEHSQDVEVKDCDAGRLRALCEACPSLRVEPEDGGEWSALLVDRNPTFVDIYDSADNYPEELWASAEAYFKSLGDSTELALPGGRYASAQALAERRLPFLSGYSLGQVCHITQIAISQRKLLGYFNGTIVPYECSTSMLKCRCAQEQRPLMDPALAGNTEFQVVGWELARTKLREILQSATIRGAGQVPLSNVKRLFRSLHQLELSETALGHSKLTELLQDSRFHDICTVQLQDRGYAVVPVSSALEADGVTGMNGAPPLGSSFANLQPPLENDGARTEPADSGEEGVCTPRRPQLPLNPNPVRRSNSAPNDFGTAGKSDNSALDSMLAYGESSCSSRRDFDSGRGLRDILGNWSGRSVSNDISDPLSPLRQAPALRGAGAELRAQLQQRFSRTEGAGSPTTAPPAPA
mmetsp:Transcript_24614/g.47978  ORF Transcript_24614/g.47978 Transcript_24614/m.47978 type:complete len:476 (-) Transcript_24614:97-1524(-)|eukprot:CAMPEP_0172708002 /NCGR_PEP_ID=MMETSP1074-20121228/50297_1 /TAXON_ID=2916 /ORGANISM="Ceratium fusus, Strain PA161109" /LENGTH=475 /DNA_ID=CAMNT_0013530881 /DNA_START=76 /DNA_END=1503 /DNA_ORIENTATION=+